ncbi:unnamed protein product [Meganyctiphanes norvegica]|uniref:DDE-1 domain-containing protein n=1 Tax=Meganyctiphanes norvegica TaxID=48144 RepID=A0AAV2PM78_MEGNR
MKDEGKSNSENCRIFTLKSSTVSTIYNAKYEAILQKAKEECTPVQACVFNNALRPPVINDLDSILCKWFRRNEERKVALTTSAIKSKARAMINVLMDPTNNIFDNKGYRIDKGKPTLRTQKKAMGPAYVNVTDPQHPVAPEDPDDPDKLIYPSGKFYFEGFSDSTHTGDSLINANAHTGENHINPNPRVMVLFLPPKAAALIQPMDQEVISKFKIIYHNMMYEKLIEHVDNTPLNQQGEHPIVNFDKKFNIFEAFLLINKAWN